MASALPVMLTLVVVLTAPAALCRPVVDLSGNHAAAPVGFGPGFVQAASGMMCAAACSASGSRNLLFKEFNGNLTTSLCATHVESLGWVSGYQLLGGAATCTVAVNGSAVVASSYACECLAADQSQGLALPASADGESCDAACNQGFDGQLGKGVMPDANAVMHACVAHNELGIANRFGYTSKAVSGDSRVCNSVQGDLTTSLAQYSCVCIYTKPRAATAADTGVSQSLSTMSVGGRRRLRRHHSV